MCWVSRKLKIKIAKKDIPVWKIVYSSTDSPFYKCCSLYKKFAYTKDVLETIPIKFEIKGHNVFGNEGFHSYSNKLKWEKGDTVVFIKNKTIFRSKKFVICIAIRFDMRIARFYIPKGYEYAENEDGEIISSAIVFDGFIE